jgi:hypothetical protein
MKSRKPTKPSKRIHRALQKQVQEYVGNYHRHWGKVSVKVSPGGTLASVHCNAKPEGRG